MKNAVIAPRSNRSRIVALACTLAIGLPPVAALADDAARIRFLEAEIQRLRTQIDEQDRRIRRLESEIDGLARTAAPVSIAVGRAAPATPLATDPQPWHSGEAWDLIATGMNHQQVTEILGEPTAVEAIDDFKTLFYRGKTADGATISGHVNLRDDQVVAVRKPAAGR